MAKQPLDIDVSDSKQLEAALRDIAEQDGGRERVVAFAARAALRAVPGLTLLDLSSGSDHPATILLPSFRAMVTPWVVVTYPTHGAVTFAARAAASDAADAADAAAGIARAADPVAEIGRAALIAADVARAARAAARAADATADLGRAALAAQLADVAAGATARAAARRADRPAADTVNAVLAARAAYAADLKQIAAGKTLEHQRLWPDGVPVWATDGWSRLRDELIERDEDWEVWTTWYDARVSGQPTHLKLSAAANERIEVARVLEIEQKDWHQGPAHVNAKIKAIIERERVWDQIEHDGSGQTLSVSGGRLDDPPAEPDPGPGPIYSIQEGQLHLDPSPPTPSDEASSAALLPLLQRATADLQQLCQKLDNTHPRLTETVRNYAATLDAPFEGLSVPSVWAYGGLLAELKQGFEAQSPLTMTEALEPEVSAQLANVVRQHAAFILGTEQGRDLVERADRFQQAPQTIEEIREPAEEILDELSDNEDLVDAETRAAHAPIRDHLRTIEWGACRTSYVGYLIVRKATFAMLRLVVGKEVSFISLLGATAAAGAIAGDPNLEFLRVALPVLRDHASAILAFYKHSPELRSYAEYALDLIDAAEEKLDPRVKPEDDA